MQSSVQKTLHLVIHGSVQGVFFRASMQREAQHLGVSGWVRNRNDGAVEAMVQGEQAAIEAMVRWAQRGPELAHVNRVEINEGVGNFSSFDIA